MDSCRRSGPAYRGIIYISDRTEIGPHDSARPTRAQVEAILYVLQRSEGLRPVSVLGTQTEVAPTMQRFLEGLRATASTERRLTSRRGGGSTSRRKRRLVPGS